MVFAFCLFSFANRRSQWLGLEVNGFNIYIMSVYGTLIVICISWFFKLKPLRPSRCSCTRAFVYYMICISSNIKLSFVYNEYRSLPWSLRITWYFLCDLIITITTSALIHNLIRHLLSDAVGVIVCSQSKLLVV